MGQRSGLPDIRPYRPCVGLMLFNAAGKVFVGTRVDTPGDHWQMPQGGIDPGETPRQAAMRELAEEVGTTKAEIVAECTRPIRYDLPRDLSRRSEEHTSGLQSLMRTSYASFCLTTKTTS